jgi:potassium uptake Trk family protein
MWNNLGLTLTPDSMISFRDAEWPMFIMSFLALAGNTFYPVFLRLVIWAMAKLLPKSSSLQDPLNFLLEHPRRCFTLLFPSRHTWALFGILFALNFVDTLLIIVLDLHNPEVAELPVGQRILAAIFQAASARHTGTSSFVLSEVNPAVQLSLVVMMYISVFPIAISIRASNTYEERSLGVYQPEEVDANEQNTTTSYLIRHMQNQLSFDLWYIFLGVFCICIAEAGRIMDLADPVRTNHFRCNGKSLSDIITIGIHHFRHSLRGHVGLVSTHHHSHMIGQEVKCSCSANVGLSLGVPTANVSLCGKFTTFSKIVICIMMIRGRHRGLPYEIDRAIMLPDERLLEDNDEPRKSSDTRRSKMLAAGLFRAS